VAFVVDAAGRSLARDVASGRFPSGVTELPLHFPMSPVREERVRARLAAARTVLDRVRAGEDVVFITEGDPLLYSSFQHLLAAMPPDVPIRVCPGVTSLTAAAADAVTPLVIEDERLLVVTAGDALENLGHWLAMVDTLVLYKVHRHLAGLADALRAGGALAGAILVQRATQQAAACMDLEDWSGEPVPYLSLVIARGTRT
jgi:precorrin-2 C(20)-methyltransferase